MDRSAAEAGLLKLSRSALDREAASNEEVNYGSGILLGGRREPEGRRCALRMKVEIIPASNRYAMLPRLGWPVS